MTQAGNSAQRRGVRGGWIALILLGGVAIWFIVIYIFAQNALDENKGTAFEEQMKVSGAWARAASAGETATEDSMGGMNMSAGTGTSAVYMTIFNDTDEDETLVSVTTDVAGQVQLHETVVDANDVAQMLEIEDGIRIFPGEKAELAPRGKHIMLFNLKHDLVTGETITLKLKFKSGRSITVDVPVQAP
ncbi:MAG TPA: copper chaperone PCu(A)C [Aggregatilineaceae bacterium]|nr:copper chaperone PCu(A)C [Aggregatilineaceae bacterium]